MIDVDAHRQNNIEEIVLEALNQNDLVALIEGKNGYKIELSSFVPASYPTNWNLLLKNGIYKIYNNYSSINILNVIENSLEKMLSMDLYDIYCAIEFIFNQIVSEHYDVSPFYINTDILFDKIRNAIIKNEKEFKSDFEWAPHRQEQAVWQEIMRINNVLKSYGIIMLDDLV